MDIQTVTDREFGENSYIVSGDGALYVIDPGIDYDAVNDAVKRTGLPVKYVFLTHGHYDHTFSVRNFKGTQVYAHSAEKPLLEDASKNLSAFTGKPFSIEGINYYDGQNHTIDDIEITHTPGHTAGCVVIRIKDSLFSGDTLFYDTVGRTDLPGGDPEALKRSLLLFDKFDKNLKVYPGHGAPFILGDAYKINFYLRRNRT